MILTPAEIVIAVQMALPCAVITQKDGDSMGASVRFKYLGRTYRCSEYNLSIEECRNGMLEGSDHARAMGTLLRLGLVKAISESLIPNR